MYNGLFVMLVGLPGSGKSTYAEKAAAEEKASTEEGLVWLSSDAIREELFGNAAIQKNPAKVFSLMRERTLEALLQAKTVIYDATNLTKKDRAAILSILPEEVDKRCVIFDVPVEVCIKRDAARERSVGKEVILKMAKKYEEPTFDEGFYSLHYIYCSEEEDNIYDDGEV